MNTSPIIISQIGNGPTTALDLRLIPDDTRLRILHAANILAGAIGDGRVVVAEDSDAFAEAAIDELGAAVSALDDLFTPKVPATAEYGSGLQQRYPVIRNGEEVFVLLEHMTDLELRATEARIRFQAAADARHADELEASRSGS
ncbi:hypothetical protein [Variovorax sp. JS1663]|uniref:hypothetical protein n=1 Tax=Variovorax sp. JS1663 TaxID=1851577 RepID=UPI000B34831A|nr:hypothetical protein [Variovorax sp. JS1663]OUM01643.1 hypothetical protein A8M77_15330 [Variovorax sp. JS1663]